MPVHYHNSPPQLNSACSMWWLVYIHFATLLQISIHLYELLDVSPVHRPWLFFREAVEKAKGLVLINACA